jgi:hypothetical protein
MLVPRGAFGRIGQRTSRRSVGMRASTFGQVDRAVTSRRTREDAHICPHNATARTGPTNTGLTPYAVRRRPESRRWAIPVAIGASQAKDEDASKEE